MPQLRRLLVIATAVAALLPVSAAAENDSSQVHFGRDIYVEQQDAVGDVVCIACTIHVRGAVSGDAVAIMGSVVLEQSSRVNGGVTSVIGDVRLQNNTEIGGDVTAVAGELRRDPQSKIGGDVTALGGTGWMLLILLAPLAAFGGFIALLVWLFHRKRPVAQAAA